MSFEFNRLKNLPEDELKAHLATLSPSVLWDLIRDGLVDLQQKTSNLQISVFDTMDQFLDEDRESKNEMSRAIASFSKE